MAATKAEVVQAIEQAVAKIEQAAASLPEDAWEDGVYENGWNAREILCHLAADSSNPSVVLLLAGPPSAGPGATFDQDAFNAAQVAARRDKSVAELLEEMRANYERSISAVEAASDEFLSQPFELQGVSGSLAEVIIFAVRDHTGEHLAALRSAVE